jgi:hypothetical protein
MGYTHYWGFAKRTGNAKRTEELYQKAIKDCQKVIQYAKKNIVNLSGYSAHTTGYGGINFNGVREEAHEPFVLREHLNQNEHFTFCKTARKDYDVVVTACLAILKYRLKNYIDVSSDGHPEDFIEGVALARHVLKRNIHNPLGRGFKLVG